MVVARVVAVKDALVRRIGEMHTAIEQRDGAGAHSDGAFPAAPPRRDERTSHVASSARNSSAWQGRESGVDTSSARSALAAGKMAGKKAVKRLTHFATHGPLTMPLSRHSEAEPHSRRQQHGAAAACGGSHGPSSEIFPLSLSIPPCLILNIKKIGF